MKIIVTNPPWPGEGYGTRSNIRWPHRRGDKVLTYPIYLAYLTSLLKSKGFETWGVDAVDKEWGIFEFVDQAKKFNPEIIFMEVSTPSLPHDLQCAEQLKEKIGCTIVFVGPHVNYFHERFIKNYGFIDYCIRDEVEFTALELAQALKEGKPIKNINGLTYRGKDGKPIANEKRSFETNIDQLPFPDRDDFPIESYQQAFFAGKKTALMVSSRGCPAVCTFCIWPQTMTGHLHRTRSAKNMVDEIEYVMKKYGVDEIYFDDDTFIVNKQRVYELCDEMIKRTPDIKWLCMSRVGSVDPDILKKMHQAGCREIFYGFESGSQKLLNSIKKGATLQQAINAVRMTQKAGMYATGSFIVGLPEDDLQSIKETLKFAIKLRADYVQFVLAAAFPGTSLYDQVEKENLLQLNSWEDLDGTHGGVLRTKYLTNHELEGAVRKMYVGYYTAPPIILKNLANVRSLADVRKIVRGAKSIVSRVMYYKE